MKNNAQPRASRRAKQPWIDPSAALAELSLLAADQPIRPIEPRQKTPEPSEYEKDTDTLIRDILVAGSLKELLREARAASHTSLRGIAKKAGMAHSQLLAIENSNGKVELNTLARIAEALDCELRVSFVPIQDSKQTFETRL